MLGVPFGLAIFFALTGLVWLANVTHWMHSGALDRAKVLSFSVWTAALFGCALTLVRRLGIGGPASLLLIAGTMILLFMFTAAALAGGKKGAPNQWLVTLTVAITAVEVLFLLIHGDGITQNIPEVLALGFLPGIVIQIRNSGATKEQLLRLAARVSTFVVWGSVILGFLAPALAYGEGYSDQRRLKVLGLTMRLAGFTPHPNFLSVTALMCIVLVLAVKMRGRWLTVLVCLAAIGMAESRNAIVTLVLVACVAWVCSGKSILGRSLLMSPVALLVLIFGVDLEDSSLTSDISTNGRFRIWDIVLHNFNEDPFNGWGPLAFQDESKSPLLRAGLQHAHNQVLQGIAEGGVLGGVLIVALLFSLVRIAAKHRYEAIYPSMLVIFLMGIATEPFLTLHLYGLNYAVLPAFLMFVVMMSADAASVPEAPRAVREKPRNDLPAYFAKPNAETGRLLGITK